MRAFRLRPESWSSSSGRTVAGNQPCCAASPACCGPSCGQVQVAGQKITDLSGRALAQARMALGMVFQQPHLIRRRSVLANILTGTLGRHRGLLVSLGRLPPVRGAAGIGQSRSGWSARFCLAAGRDPVGRTGAARLDCPRLVPAAEGVAGGRADRKALIPKRPKEVMRLLRRLRSRAAWPCSACCISPIWRDAMPTASWA